MLCNWWDLEIKTTGDGGKEIFAGFTGETGRTWFEGWFMPIVALNRCNDGKFLCFWKKKSEHAVLRIHHEKTKFYWVNLKTGDILRLMKKVKGYIKPYTSG